MPGLHPNVPDPEEYNDGNFVEFDIAFQFITLHWPQSNTFLLAMSFQQIIDFLQNISGNIDEESSAPDVLRLIINCLKQNIAKFEKPKD